MNFYGEQFETLRLSSGLFFGVSLLKLSQDDPIKIVAADEEEDERLIASVQEWGTNWTKVAREVGSRSADQCSSHWSHVLDPNINYCDWTEEEDADLLHEVLTYGTKWAQIASCHNPARTTLALKNRYSTLRLKNENRSRTRQDMPESSQGSRQFQRTNSRGSEKKKASNWSERSEVVNSDDEEDEEEEDEPEEETDQVIHAWLDDASNDSSNNASSRNTQRAGTGSAENARLGTINVSMPDDALASWDEWAKTSLPTPNATHDSLPTLSPIEGESMGVDEYLQLDPALLLSGSAQQSFNIPGSCFFESDEPCTATQNTSYALYDTTGCFQPTPVTNSPGSLAQTPAGKDPMTGVVMEQEANSYEKASSTTPLPSPGPSIGAIVAASKSKDWTTGNNAPGNSPSSSPSLVTQLATSSATSTSKLRVSITLTCDQAQLVSVMTQLTDYGTGVSINVEKDC
ncbi:hypothetical protein J7T55_011211 [Diaporthe amygdali]|uniref:uncharacterized protein n=1 Tax=Phomopsis amygdali TaxID=1214568 RepID=UPI0022FE2762|nr:uncharacterized protein J7T55_011211 [Diaporthe amygdali]KAJ0108721.1 hypothetical protein J7T55_011211 [Diaporthe amygdali]